MYDSIMKELDIPYKMTLSSKALTFHYNPYSSKRMREKGKNLSECIEEGDNLLMSESEN